MALGIEVPEIALIQSKIAESVPFCAIYSFPREGIIEFGNTVATNLSGGIRRKLGVFSQSSCRSILPIIILWQQVTLHDTFDVCTNAPDNFGIGGNRFLCSYFSVFYGDDSSKERL
jgi:hypothetical protein